MKRKTAAILAGIMAITALSGCGKKTEGNAIRVGSKDFTESLVVSEIYALALEDAGYTVERKQNIAGSVIHTAITNNEIDLYPEYTGTGLLSVLQMDMESDPDKVYSIVKDEYEKRFDISWLASTAVNDRNGMAITTEAAKKYNVYTMSDLQREAPNLKLCSQGEFEHREDGLPGLAKVYGDFSFKSVNVYDNGIKYQILENNEADVCPGYSTEAQLSQKDKFTYLEDDKSFWPPYYLAPIVRNETLRAHPEIRGVLDKVSAALDTDTVIELNAKVDIDKQEYEEVAKEFYGRLK